MNARRIRSVLMLSLILVFAAGVYAQRPVTTAEGEPFFVGGFYFFSAIVAGLVTAMAIGLLLSGICTAAGITMVKPEKMIRPHEKKPEEGKSSEGKGGSVVDKAGATMMKLNSAFGIWALVTGVISLFFAGWFAVAVSGTVSFFVGTVVALTVWGLFYLTLTALEAKMLSSTLGALHDMAASAMHEVGSGFKAVLGKSEADRAADVAEKVTREVREEMFGDISSRKLKKELRRYVHQLSPPSAHEIKKELASLLNETEMSEILGHDQPEIDSDALIASLETHARGKKQATSAVGRIKEGLELLKQERGAGKDNISAAIDAGLEMSGEDRDEAEHTRHKIEDYLRSTHKAELEPEAIRENIEKIFKSPRKGLSEMRGRIGAVDHDTAVGLLEQRGDIDHAKAEQIVGRVQHIVDELKSAVSSEKESVSQTKANIEAKMRRYLDSLDQPELDYDEIKADLHLLFHDPKAGAEALINRLRAMDRDTIKAILASKKDMSEDDAEKMLEHVESARDEVIKKAEKMKEQLEHKMRQAREEAAEITEQTRKNASVAAWWSVAAAVGSAAAAVIGGLVAVGMYT